MDSLPSCFTVLVLMLALYQATGTIAVNFSGPIYREDTGPDVIPPLKRSETQLSSEYPRLFQLPDRGMPTSREWGGTR
jgi:hypothetical protein